MKKHIPQTRPLVPNPFANGEKLTPSAHRKAIARGVVTEATKLSAGGRSKATYSRTLAGQLQRTHPEVIYHLRKRLFAAGLAT